MDVFTTQKVDLVKVVASELDSLGYITYVFEYLEQDRRTLSPYLMCIRWPNWEHKHLDLGEIGYVEYKEIREGIDTWFDGNKLVPYRYSTVQFIKFINHIEKIDYIM